MAKKFHNGIAEENGKFYYRVYHKGKTFQGLAKGATSYEEARIIRTGVAFNLKKKSLGYDVPEEEKRYTTKYMFNKFLTYAKGKRSYKKDVYQSEFLQKYFEENKLDDDLKKIKQKHISELQKYLKSTPTKRGKIRANSTVNKYIACLKTAFNLMVKDEDIDISFNPCFGVSMLPEDNRRDTYLPEKLADKFLDLLPEMVRDIVNLDLATGLRIGNVIHVRKKEFNLYEGIWRIPKEKNKGKKEIQIKLNSKALAIVNKYYYKEKDYLFINPETQKHITTIGKSFSTAAKKVGIPDLLPKDIRRTVGTWLYHKGVSLRVIRDIFHHSNVSTTERYLGITPQEVNEAYEMLNTN